MHERERGVRDDERCGIARALLVASSGGVREAVGRKLAKDTHLQVAAAVSGGGALDALGDSRFDLILLDLGTFGSDAVQIVRRVAHDSSIHLPIVVLGPEPDEHSAARILAAGAAAYVTDEGPDSDLEEAVGAALAGRRYISASLRDRMAFRYVDGT